MRPEAPGGRNGTDSGAEGHRRAAREFAEGEFKERAREFDEKEEFDLSIWKRRARSASWAPSSRRSTAGRVWATSNTRLITEEFWRVDPGCGQAVLSCTFGSEMIQAFGTEEQKKRYLPPLVKGKAILGFGITEPDAGSDAAGMKTRAVRKGDTYVINGAKMFITNGCLARHLLVFCLTHPDNPNAHKRHSVILIDTDSPGYQATKIHGKMGIGPRIRRR